MSQARRSRAVLIVALGAIVALVMATASCSLPATGCDLSIAAVRDPAAIDVGDVLPADAAMLVRPVDIDPFGGSAANDPQVGPSITIKLQPDAAERIAIHTRDHVGEAFVVSVGGTIVSVPVIMSPIEDGAIQLSGPSDDKAWLQRFEGCVPTVLIPS